MRTLIGLVNGTKLDKNDERVAWIKPLFEARGSTWVAVENAWEAFPPRGYLFWPRATPVERGDLLQFRSKENSYRKEGGDEFMVVDPRPVHEVIDLRQFGDCEGVRKALVAGIPGIPIGRHLVWCDGDQVIGPVQLILSGTGETTIDRNNRAQIGCFQFKAGEVLTFTSEDGPRAVILKPGNAQAFVDWDDDAPVLRRAIKHAVESSSSAQFPKQAIDEFAERLVRSGASSENHLEQYRIDRLRWIAKSAEGLLASREEVVQLLLKHPVVAAELKKAYEAETERARTEIQEALGKARVETTRLETRIEELLEANEAAKVRLEETKAKIEQECAAAEMKVQERLAAVLRDAPKLLADVSLLRPFLGRNDSSDSQCPIRVEYPSWQLGSKLVTSPVDLKRRLLASFKSFGVEGGAYQPIHAAFAGALLPVLGGSHAVEALQAYAQVVAAGRCVVVQVTSAVADIQDLFGRVVQGRFIPEASGLIDIIRAASSSSGLFVVVLDGINRGPTESYLLPLVRSVVRRGGEISLFHPAGVSSSDPYRGEARLKWPENLLLAATVLEGPTTLPVAPALWADGVYIDVQAVPRVGAAGEPSDASLELFRTNEEKVDVEWVQQVLPSAERVAFRFEAGLRTVASEGFSKAVTRSVIVPIAASMPNEAERIGKGAEKELGESIEELVAGARRRLA
ncbi:MAG: hypothetical protein JST16_09540 [Bdellovibrionales bacterium]|nr:hypothetical protein [Bdellovibrionales bacterium]